jgi:hypothetical protein
MAAYLLYITGILDLLHFFKGYGYISVVIGGMLYTFGFTAPFGAVILWEISPDVNPITAAVVAGTGALVTDLLIFRIIRKPFFEEELRRFRTSRLIRAIHRLFHHETVSEHLRLYATWLFVAFVIASPLPDEFGVSLIGGLTAIKERSFAFLSFIFNTLGILALLLLARL